MSVNYVHLPHSPQESATPDPFDLACAQAARRFHSSIPEYAPTPLVSLPSLAAKTGVASIHVKDESYRFGLDAFKVLGGSQLAPFFHGGKIQRFDPFLVQLKLRHISCQLL